MSYDQPEICEQYRPWVGQEPRCGNCGHPREIHVPGTRGRIAADPQHSTILTVQRRRAVWPQQRHNPHRHRNKHTRRLMGLGHMATNAVGKLDKRKGPRAGRVRKRAAEQLLNDVRSHIMSDWYFDKLQHPVDPAAACECFEADEKCFLDCVECAPFIAAILSVEAALLAQSCHPEAVHSEGSAVSSPEVSQ